MRVTGNLYIDDPSKARDQDLGTSAALGTSKVLDRFEAEMARIQGLSDQAIEALCTIIDAKSTFEVMRKLYRFVAALVCPAPVLARAFARDLDTFNQFCLQLWAYRVFLERLEHGASPSQAATAVEHARRIWLERALRTYSGVVAPQDDEEDETVDVYDAEGEIDPGAVRAEIDCLLRRLEVDPERIEITVLPDEFGPPYDMEE